MIRRHTLACVGMRSGALAYGGMRWHANECQLATLNSQPSTLSFQQGRGVQGGNCVRRGRGKVEKIVENGPEDRP